MRNISKTFYQPIGGVLHGISAGSEIAVNTCGLSAGMFLSIAIDQCCEVDRVKSVGTDGTIKTYGNRSGKVTVQAMADLSGCWLQIDVIPPEPISVGLICASPNGVLLDRSFPECALGRSLTVNGKPLGDILGAAVMPDGRSVLSVSTPIKIEGVGVAHAGRSLTLKGKRSGHSPFVTVSGSIPEIGNAKMTLLQGWRSAKSCIPDTISYSKVLCSGVL